MGFFQKWLCQKFILIFYNLAQAHVSTISVVNEGIKVARFNMLIMFVALFDLLLYVLAVLGVVKLIGSKKFHDFWRSKALKVFWENDVVFKVSTCLIKVFGVPIAFVLAILELINSFFGIGLEGGRHEGERSSSR